MLVSANLICPFSLHFQSRMPSVPDPYHRVATHHNGFISLCCMFVIREITLPLRPSSLQVLAEFGCTLRYENDTTAARTLMPRPSCAFRIPVPFVIYRQRMVNNNDCNNAISELIMRHARSRDYSRSPGNAGRDSGKRYTIRLPKSNSARCLVVASRVSGPNGNPRRPFNRPFQERSLLCE